MSRLERRGSTGQECLGHSQCIDLLRCFLAVVWVVECFGLAFRLQGFGESIWSFSEMLPYSVEWLGTVLAALCLLLGIKFLRSRVQLGLLLSIIGLLGTQAPDVRHVVTWHLNWISGAWRPWLSWKECFANDCIELAKPLCYVAFTVILAFGLRRLRHAE